MTIEAPPKRKGLTEFTFLAPLCRGMAFGGNGAEGRILYEKGKNRVLLEKDRPRGRHRGAGRIGFETSFLRLAGREEVWYSPARVPYRGPGVQNHAGSRVREAFPL